MPTTTKGLRYPASSNAPNVPQDIQNLASDVDGELFSNGGTSGAVAGTAPAAGTPMTMKTVYGSQSFNASGDTTVIFPGGAFANGLCGVWVNHFSLGGAPSNDLEFVPWQTSATLSSVNLRCYGPTGAIFGSTGVVVAVVMIGW